MRTTQDATVDESLITDENSLENTDQYALDTDRVGELSTEAFKYPLESQHLKSLNERACQCSKQLPHSQLQDPRASQLPVKYLYATLYSDGQTILDKCTRNKCSATKHNCDMYITGDVNSKTMFYVAVDRLTTRTIMYSAYDQHSPSVCRHALVH